MSDEYEYTLAKALMYRELLKVGLLLWTLGMVGFAAVALVNYASTGARPSVYGEPFFTAMASTGVGICLIAYTRLLFWRREE